MVPFWGSSGDVTPRVLQANFGDGYSQRVPDGLNNIEEKWSLKWDILTLAEKNAIVAFFEARKGAESILMTMPGESVQKTWICSAWSSNQVSYAAYSLSASFVRVYDI